MEVLRSSNQLPGKVLPWPAAGRFYIHVQMRSFFADNDTLSHLHRLETTPFFTRGKGRENGMQLEQTTNVMRNALVIYFNYSLR